MSPRLTRRTPTSEQHRLRILFLAANPSELTALDLAEEVRDVKLTLDAVAYRDSVEYNDEHAVRPDDLVRFVRRYKPNVVHFSGHGSTPGIYLHQESGGAQLVPGERLRKFLEGRGVRLVVLNACHSKDQADALMSVVDAVVGTTDAVGDEAARRFSSAFYRGMGNGLSVGDAFRDGCDAVALNDLTDVFHCSGNVALVLAGPPQRTWSTRARAGVALLLTAIATAIVLVTVLRSGTDRPEPAPPPAPLSVPAVIPEDPAEERARVEGLVGEWLGAWMSGDTDSFVRLASVPFYFDQRIVLTKVELRAAFDSLKTQKLDSWRAITISRIKVQTAGELQSEGRDLSRDRVFGNLNLTLDDYAVIITLRVGEREEGMLVVVRRRPSLQIVGTWD